MNAARTDLAMAQTGMVTFINNLTADINGITEDVNKCNAEAARLSDELLKNQGCIGGAPAECRASLSLSIDFKQPASEDDSQKVDVNGNPVEASRLIHWAGWIRKLDDNDSTMVDVTLDQANRVKSLSISLPKNPLWANTEEEYDNTQVYAVTATVLNDKCPDREKIKFYRFIQNSLKPTASDKKTGVNIDWDHASEASVTQTRKLPFCGRMIGLTSDIGHDTDAITRYNRNGNYSLYQVIIE